VSTVPTWVLLKEKMVKTFFYCGFALKVNNRPNTSVHFLLPSMAFNTLKLPRLGNKEVENKEKAQLQGEATLQV